PTEIADAWLNSFLSLDLIRALVVLVGNPPHIPNLATVRAQAAANRERFPMQHMFGRIVLDERHILKATHTEEETMNASFLQLYSMYQQFGSIDLHRAMNRLEAEKGLTAEVLVEFLRAGKVFDAATLEMVSIGIERYFAQDYVSALHILVPQF